MDVAIVDCSAMPEACTAVPYYPYLVIIPKGSQDPEREWQVLTENRRYPSPADQALSQAMHVLHAVLPPGNTTAGFSTGDLSENRDEAFDGMDEPYHAEDGGAGHGSPYGEGGGPYDPDDLGMGGRPRGDMDADGF